MDRGGERFSTTTRSPPYAKETEKECDGVRLSCSPSCSEDEESDDRAEDKDAVEGVLTEATCGEVACDDAADETFSLLSL